MALKSTIFKAQLDVSDIDHNHYHSYTLTLARHPSETDERMMVRLAAFAFEAWRNDQLCDGHGNMSFGAGLSDPNEPDVWLQDLTGATQLWVEVGQPDDKPIMRACGKSTLVAVYAFSHAAQVWWQGIQNKLTRPKNLRVFQLDSEACKSLQTLAERSMRLSAVLQDGNLTLSSELGTVDILATTLLAQPE